MAQAIASKMHYISEYAPSVEYYAFTTSSKYGGYAYSYLRKLEEGERTPLILKVMNETERTEEIARNAFRYNDYCINT